MKTLKNKKFKTFWLSILYGFIILVGIVYSCQMFINTNPKSTTWQDYASYDFDIIEQTYDDETNEVKNVYGISTPQQLAGVFSLNEQQSSKDKNSVYAESLSSISNNTYVLMNDINLSGSSWSISSSFSQTFDGNFHTISNLNISSSSQYVGMVGTLSGTIKNLFLENVKIYNNSSSTYSYTGAIAGKNNGTIQNVAVVSGTVYGSNYDKTRYTGGITGYNEDTIKNCITDLTVSTGVFIGGIAGYNEGPITNCFNYGPVQDITNIGRSTRYCGGITGFSTSSGTLNSCYNSGSINSNGSSSVACYAGGIAAYTATSISQCANEGFVSAGYTGSTKTNYAGGIAGYSTKVISNCSNSGDIKSYAKSTTTTTTQNKASNTIDNSKATKFDMGKYLLRTNFVYMFEYEYKDEENLHQNTYNRTTTSLNAYAGGIVGYGTSTCSNCYNSGSVSGGYKKVQYRDVVTIEFCIDETLYTRAVRSYAIFNVKYTDGLYYSPINGNRTKTTNNCYSTKDYGSVSSSDFSITADYSDFGASTSDRNSTNDKVFFTADVYNGFMSFAKSITVQFSVSNSQKTNSNGVTYSLKGSTDLWLYSSGYGGNASNDNLIGSNDLFPEEKSGKHHGPYYTVDEEITITKDYKVSSYVSASSLGSSYWASSSSINDGEPYLKNLYW